VKRPIATTLLATLVGAAVATAGVLLLGVGSRGAPSSARATTASSPASSTGARREVASTALTATQIYQRDSSGVVAIQAVTSEGADSGTGIVLNSKGLILTNDHVIAGARSITVASKGSSSVTRAATVVGEEANSDLALIRIDPSGLGLKPLNLASSSTVQVGDPVYAIGNPYGLDETLTKGIVSALGREISAPDGAKITGVIQTDAALNPGNSGGPLLDEQGEVIGVNSQIASDAASVAGSQPGSTGVGFAISSNTVAEVVKTILAGKGISSEAASRSRAQSESVNGAGSPYGSRSPYGSSSPYDEAEASGLSSEASAQAEAPGSSSEAGAESASTPNTVEGGEAGSGRSGSAGAMGDGGVVIVP
jgi:putative serine protease PepD